MPADYNGDGRDDLATYTRATGAWRIQNQSTVTFGEPSDLPVPADYDGNGTADIAVYRRRTGAWMVRNQFTMAWGAPNDVPVPMDTTRDGRAELMVYRRSNGTWYARGSRDGRSGTRRPGVPPGIFRRPLAWSASLMSAGDIDADGRKDVAIWRPGTVTGVWSVLESRTSFTTASFRGWGSGSAGDVPVPADYDGDMRIDMAVWRPGDGMWHILTAGGTQSFSIPWGAGSVGDLPVPADYDGNRRADLAVWRFRAPGGGSC